ncbi:MAG TPA: hypothetical protein VLW55_09030 [Burkholderiaceae bacterium]|nr:hypothetical protein [Burkholderiaceae bacterium]
MNDARNAAATMAEVANAAASTRAPSIRSRFRFGEVSLYALLALLVLVAWQVSELGYFTSRDDFGYWLGVAGGTMMLLLFAYPMRKHLRFMQRLGPLKYWFVVHMVFGIAGPMLILLHSTFKVGSMNAAIALTCMIIVALSGIVGRFLYRQIHRGFLGERSSLRELQLEAGFEQDAVKSRFHFVPDVELRLLAFEAETLKGGASLGSHLRRVFVLPVRRRIVYFRCRRDVNTALARIARHLGWRRKDLERRKKRAHALLDGYLSSVVRVAQFQAYDRLFALWHVLHIPFVYVLVVSAIAHVIAVHVY